MRPAGRSGHVCIRIPCASYTLKKKHAREQPDVWSYNWQATSLEIMLKTARPTHHPPRRLSEATRAGTPAKRRHSLFSGHRASPPPAKRRRAKLREGWRRRDPSSIVLWALLPPSISRIGGSRSGLVLPLLRFPSVGWRPPSRSGRRATAAGIERPRGGSRGQASWLPRRLLDWHSKSSGSRLFQK